MEMWSKFQKFCSLQGKFVMTLATLQLFALMWYATVTGKPMADGATTIYLVVVGAYTANKTMLKTKDKQIQLEREKNGHGK